MLDPLAGKALREFVMSKLFRQHSFTPKPFHRRHRMTALNTLTSKLGKMKAELTLISLVLVLGATA